MNATQTENKNSYIYIFYGFKIDCPAGYIPIAFRIPKEEESFIYDDGQIDVCISNTYVEPKMIIKKLPEIEGFEYTGEFRAPKLNEYFSDGLNLIISKASSNWSDSDYSYRFIVKKKEKTLEEKIRAAIKPHYGYPTDIMIQAIINAIK